MQTTEEKEIERLRALLRQIDGYAARMMTGRTSHLNAIRAACAAAKGPEGTNGN